MNYHCSMHCEMEDRLHGCGSQPGTGRPKSQTKKHFFSEKKCVDCMIFAVRTTGQPYGTITYISLKNNFNT